MRRAFLEHSGPIPFAHRGGAEEAPENTLAAFEAATALGYRYLETDVHVTADGAVVAFHDSVLDRVTDRTGSIAALSLNQIREADAGYAYSVDGGRSHPFRGRGLRIPTLSELLERWPHARVNIDVKTDSTVQPLCDTLRAHDAFNRVCVGSFSDTRLARVRAVTHEAVCTSMGQRAAAMAFLASRAGRMPSTHADCVQVPRRWRGVTVVDRLFVRGAHRAGLPVHVWTVNDEPTMTMLLDLGVDGVMTDRPRLLRSVLTQRGQWSDAAPEDQHGEAGHNGPAPSRVPGES